MELPLPIETSRLRLRSFVPEDLDALHAIQSREDTHRWLYSEPHSVDDVREVIERRIARVREAPETGVTLAVELAATGELLGDVSLTVGAPERRQAEIGFTFHPGHHGRGYATEAAVALGLPHLRPARRLRAPGAPEHDVRARAREARLRREAHLVENEWVKGEWQRASGRASYALLAREWRGAG